MSAVAFDLRRQTEAAKRLMCDLREAGLADDADLVADTIEGETTFNETVERVLSEIDECEVVAVGLKAKEAAFSSRRAAIEKRAETLRAMIERAMIEAEAPKLTLTTGTVYLSKRPPGVMIEDEAAIPSRFWSQPAPPEPKIDKAGIKAALKAGEIIPGVRLDNGALTLNVRR